MPVISNVAAQGAGTTRDRVLRVWSVFRWAVALALLSPPLSDGAQAQIPGRALHAPTTTEARKLPATLDLPSFDPSAPLGQILGLPLYAWLAVAALAAIVALWTLHKHWAGKTFVLREEIQRLNARLARQKDTEDALGRNRDFLDRTGQLARVGGWEIDYRNQSVHWAEPTRAIFEVDPDYTPTREETLEFFGAEARQRIAAQLEHAKRTGQALVFDEQITTARGNRLWVRVRGEPILEEGQCVKMVGAILDITELKTAQIRLLEERDLFTAGPVMVFRWGAGEDIPIEYASPSVRQLGYEPEDFTAGRIGLKHIVHPEDTQRVNLPPDRASRMGDPAGRGIEYRVIGADGEVRWIFDFTIPHYDDQGRLRYADGYLLDITDRKKTEAQLQRARRLDALGVLAGGIAHDFNNILTAVLGNINLARLDETDRAEAAEILAEAETATLRAKELAQQLLTFSKGGTPVRKAELVGPCIRDTVSFCLRGSKVRGELDIDDDLWPARIDAGQISQVINNIVLNSLQAMPTGGRLSVTACNYDRSDDYLPIPQGRYVKITLRDEGCGITQDHLDRIFDPYFTTKQSGSGLGLAVSYAIVQKHDGFLWAESAIGEGSTFHIALPAAREEVEQPVESSRRQPAPAGEGRILIMDDDVMVARTVRRMLTSRGYEVTVVHDGAEAIELYRSRLEEDEPFDVVVLDLTVPGGMGGAETISRLRKLDPEVRAIVSSGYSSDPVVANYRDYGFQAVASKPYNMDTIVNAVQGVLGDAESSPA